MQGYLVMGICTMDAIPMGWFADEALAVKMANDLDQTSITAMAESVFGVVIHRANVVGTNVVPISHLGVPQKAIPCKKFY